MARNKYGNRRVASDGYTFDSQAEFLRYRELRLLERAGIITGLRVHPRYEIIPGFRHNGKKVRATYYEPDFVYVEGGRTIAEDIKGKATQVYRIKMRLFILQYEDIEFREVAA